MIDGNPLLSFYLELNILLFAIWILHRFSKKLADFLNWHFSYHSQLITTRVVFLGVFLVPVLFRALSYFIDLNEGGYLQRPAEFVFAVFDNLTVIDSGSTVTLLEGNAAGYSPGILAVILFLGYSCFALLAGRLLYKIICLYRKIGKSYCWKHIGKIYIHVSNDIAVPFSTRIFGKSQIIVPETLFVSADYFPVIIAHEGQHLRNGDVSWEIVLEIFSLLFYWNPAIYLWRSDFTQLQEYACDEMVLGAGMCTSREYANCLLHVTEQFNSSLFAPVASSSMAGISFSKRISNSQLARRMQVLIQKKSPCQSRSRTLAHRVAITSVTAILGLFIVACNNISPSLNAPSTTDFSGPQILVETVIVRIELNENYQRSADWPKLNNELNVAGDDPSPEDYIKALEVMGNVVQILARPKVMTLNNQLARIQSQNGGRATGIPLSRSISMEFIPEITESGIIVHDIDIEVKSLVEANELESTDNEPVYETHRFLIRAVTRSGEISVFGPHGEPGSANIIFLVKASVVGERQSPAVIVGL